MNPVTRSLIASLKASGAPDAPALETFALAWDDLESLVISVYRAGQSTGEAEEDYQRIRHRLKDLYPDWQADLRSFWESARVAGEITRQDPYLALLQAEDAAWFVGNWEAMQTLPAAREALNGLLVYRLEEQRQAPKP